MAPLPGNAGPIEAALASAVPNGGTPTASALRGLTGFCVDYMAAHPGERCVGVFISDGAPTECEPMDAPGLAAIAAAALSKGVETYVVGMQGADFTILDAIAEAGGTDCDPAVANKACDVSASTASLRAALSGIRGQSACDYELREGASADLGTANLTFEPASGDSRFLPRAPDPTGCASGGWYAIGADRLRLCPATCADVRATGGRLVVDLGCG